MLVQSVCLSLRRFADLNVDGRLRSNHVVLRRRRRHSGSGHPALVAGSQNGFAGAVRLLRSGRFLAPLSLYLVHQIVVALFAILLRDRLVIGFAVKDRPAPVHDQLRSLSLVVLGLLQDDREYQG